MLQNHLEEEKLKHSKRMASRTTTDPLEILLEMGVDLDNLSEEEDYLSALMEAVNTLQIKNAGDDRDPLQQEIRKVRQKRKAAEIATSVTKVLKDQYNLKNKDGEFDRKKAQRKVETCRVLAY